MYTTAKREKNPDIKGEDEYMAGQLNASGEIDDTQFIGSAVFKDGVMIDKLNGQETRIVNILDDTTNIKDILTMFPDPFSDKPNRSQLRILKTENNKIKMNLKGAKPKIISQYHYSLKSCQIHPWSTYAKSKKNQKILKKHLN